MIVERIPVLRTRASTADKRHDTTISGDARPSGRLSQLEAEAVVLHLPDDFEGGNQVGGVLLHAKLILA